MRARIDIRERERDLASGTLDIRERDLERLLNRGLSSCGQPETHRTRVCGGVHACDVVQRGTCNDVEPKALVQLAVVDNSFAQFRQPRVRRRHLQRLACIH